MMKINSGGASAWFLIYQTTLVFGEKIVVRKFKVEMRLSSNDADKSHIFYGNVYSLDEKYFDASKVFTNEQFKLHNKCHTEIGNHNRDENGELVLPITIKVDKKKSNYVTFVRN